MQSSLAEIFYDLAVADEEYVYKLEDAYVVATLPEDINAWPELAGKGAVLVWSNRNECGLGYLAFDTVEEARIMLWAADGANGTQH